MCGVGHSRQARLLASQCEGLFSPVARRYGVRELSLQRELLRTPTRLLSTFLENPSASHPKAAGHSAIAWLVAEAIQRGPVHVPALPTHLPAPAFVDVGWEHTDAPWACRTYVGGTERCRALPALARDGWCGATLTVAVEGHTLLMTQCSDWDGGALLVLPSGRTSVSAAGGGGALAGAFAGVAAPRSAGAVPAVMGPRASWRGAGRVPPRHRVEEWYARVVALLSLQPFRALRPSSLDPAKEACCTGMKGGVRSRKGDVFRTPTCKSGALGPKPVCSLHFVVHPPPCVVRNVNVLIYI